MNKSVFVAVAILCALSVRQPLSAADTRIENASDTPPRARRIGINLEAELAYNSDVLNDLRNVNSMADTAEREERLGDLSERMLHTLRINAILQPNGRMMQKALREFAEYSRYLKNPESRQILHDLRERFSLAAEDAAATARALAGMGHDAESVEVPGTGARPEHAGSAASLKPHDSVSSIEAPDDAETVESRLVAETRQAKEKITRDIQPLLGSDKLFVEHFGQPEAMSYGRSLVLFDSAMHAIDMELMLWKGWPAGKLTEYMSQRDLSYSNGLGSYALELARIMDSTREAAASMAKVFPTENERPSEEILRRRQELLEKLRAESSMDEDVGAMFERAMEEAWPLGGVDGAVLPGNSKIGSNDAVLPVDHRTAFAYKKAVERVRQSWEARQMAFEAWNDMNAQGGPREENHPARLRAEDAQVEFLATLLVLAHYQNRINEQINAASAEREAAGLGPIYLKPHQASDAGIIPAVASDVTMEHAQGPADGPLAFAPLREPVEVPAELPLSARFWKWAYIHCYSLAVGGVAIGALLGCAPLLLNRIAFLFPLSLVLGAPLGLFLVLASLSKSTDPAVYAHVLNEHGDEMMKIPGVTGKIHRVLTDRLGRPMLQIYGSLPREQLEDAVRTKYPWIRRLRVKYIGNSNFLAHGASDRIGRFIKAIDSVFSSLLGPRR